MQSETPCIFLPCYLIVVLFFLSTRRSSRKEQKEEEEKRKERKVSTKQTQLPLALFFFFLFKYLFLLLSANLDVPLRQEFFVKSAEMSKCHVCGIFFSFHFPFFFFSFSRYLSFLSLSFPLSSLQPCSGTRRAKNTRRRRRSAANYIMSELGRE